MAELYEIIFEKLFFASSLSAQYKDKEPFLPEIWENLKTKQRERLFFYLKVQDQRVEMEDQKKVWEFFEKKSKMRVEVFIYRPERTSTEFFYSKYTDVSNAKHDQLKVQSSDYDTFKDFYTLDDLLNDFIRNEILEEQDSWYCSGCKKHVRAIKNISLYKIPKYLIFHLKKLKINQNKIPMITYPISNLNMSRYVLSQQTTSSYDVRPEEFYPQKDLEFYLQEK